VADELLHDRAEIHVYDPQVKAEQVYVDLEYLQKHRRNNSHSYGEQEPITAEEIRSLVHVYEEPFAAMADAHAIAVLTEWDEFKNYDWARVYDAMKKPAFVFDGRNILDRTKLTELGFNLHSIGKG